MWFKGVVVAVLASLLAGCGGGTKESAAANDVTTTSFRIQLAVSAAGAPARDVEEGQALDLTATVQRVSRTTRGSTLVSETVTAPAEPVTVEFRADAAAGRITPANGRALTNPGGVATAGFTVGAQSGAFSITAAALVEGSPTTTYLLQTVRVQRPRLEVRVLDANGPASTIRGGEVYTIEAFFDRTLVSGAALVKAAIPDATVVFSADSGEFEPASATAITGTDGIARLRFRPARVAGQYRMSAVARDNVPTATPVSDDVAYEVVVDRTLIGSGEPFAAGVAAVTPPFIAAGGSAAVSVVVRDQSGRVVVRPVSVRFTSGCVGAGTATITSPVLSVGGTATATYQARQGCVGADTIDVRAAVDGLVFDSTAQGFISVAAPVASRVEYVEASTLSLALAGRGSAQSPETAEVRFRVLNSDGVAVPNSPVAFQVLGASDARLTSTSAVTDPVTGVATASLRSGSVPGPIRVSARISTGAESQSDVIVVSSGSPDQAGLSLSASSFSPEAFDFDGETVEIGIRMVDRFGNPVPNGTQASLTAEGGAVQPSCALQGGVCTVTWTSQQPRPANGRVSILVRSLGDESFVDANGNGLYDAGETFEDLPEAWRDDNEDGAYTPGEFFADANGNGAWNGGNGRYDGTLCAPGANCGSGRTVDIRGTVVLVLASSTQNITITPASVFVNELTTATLDVAITDRNGNLPPEGTRITAETSLGQLSGDVNYTVGSGNAPGPIRLRLQLKSDTPARTGTGIVTVKATTPKGRESRGTAQVTAESVCDAPTAPLPPICQGGNVVGGITANPASVSVLRNQAAVATQILFRVTDASTQQRPFVGQSVQAVCSNAGASGYTIAPSPNAATTGSDGTARISIVVTSGDVISGTAACTFTAGGKQVVVNVRP